MQSLPWTSLDGLCGSLVSGLCRRHGAVLCQVTGLPLTRAIVTNLFWFINNDEDDDEDDDNDGLSAG